ncbi:MULTISPECIES: aspartate kinase [Streptomyces]|uniref:aspartate kinase n=1 Tax=Streptomyces TaxID=1883 RepID=UPI001318B344|nr:MULTISPECIES: aspartate kinase [Streptomyces]QGZ50978.1 aspartate kinase [Streptomyces sp. QHH-9511]
MSVAVKKFGGSSLSTPGRIRQVAEMVARFHRTGRPTVVVVSARGDSTDELLAAALELNAAPSARETDQLLATGENASAALLALALHDQGAPAVSLTGPQAGIRVSGNHGAGMIAEIDPARILAHLRRGQVVVVSGFQGSDAEGDVITLGRGGSDTTAVALATALSAASCEIYTDVKGIYTADPRVVPEARVLSTIDAGVMAEMAFAGAQVMHSRAVELAASHSIDVVVRGSFTTEPGTTILGRSIDVLESQGSITAVTHDTDIVMALTRSRRPRDGLAADVLTELARASVPVDLLSWGAPDDHGFRMGFALHGSRLAPAREALSRIAAGLGCETDVDEKVGKVSLVGVGLLNRPDYTARMLALLSRMGVTPSWVSSTHLRVSVIIPLDRVLEAVTALHQEFGLGRDDLDTPSMAAV